MNLLELSKLLLDEKLAEQYLLAKGVLKTFTSCEKCGSTKLGRIRRGKYRCYGCKADWSIRKNSILLSHQISFSKFIGVVGCFTLDLTAKQAAEELLLEIDSIIAEKFMYEKKSIVKELKKYGIQSVLTKPENLTGDTINKYLEFKAMGMI